MNIKIKTKDIDIDFTDQCSALHEDSKKRILEVIESVMTQQLSLEQVRREQEELDIRFEGEEEEDTEEWKSVDHKVNDPMWFDKAKKGEMTDDFTEGYSQAIYQMRLYLCSLDRPKEGTNETLEYTNFVLKHLYKARASQPYLKNQHKK